MTIFYLCEVKSSHFSRVQLFATPRTVSWQASVPKSCPTLFDSTDCSMPGFCVLHYFPKVCSNSCPFESMMLSNSLILCHSFLVLPSIFPSIRSFPMSWLITSSGQLRSISFSISPTNEYSRFISFRIYWFDLLALQETLKSLFQHCNSKASILWWSAFFLIQLSYLYMTTGKNIGAMSCRATKDGQVIGKDFDKMLSTARRNADHSSTLVMRIVWAVWKGTKDIIANFYF